MKRMTLYVCEICEAEYRTEQEARVCESRGAPVPSVSVGDIVLTMAGFTWHDADRRWIENPNILLKSNGARCPNGDSNCFDECCTYQFYYVVTAVDGDPDDGHRPRYHVETKAMESSYRQGYTFDRGHYTPRKVASPPQYVIDTSRDLIGRIASELL